MNGSMILFIIVLLILFIGIICDSQDPKKVIDISWIGVTLEKRLCSECNRYENIIFLENKSPNKYVCTICSADIYRLVLSDELMAYYERERFDSQYEDEIKDLEKRIKKEKKRLLKIAIPDLYVNDSSCSYKTTSYYDKGDIMVLSCKITDEIKQMYGNTSVESLGEAIKLIKDKIPDNIYRKLSFINYHRNKLAHDSSYDASSSLDDFIKTANEVLSYLHSNF